jgi:acetyl-CoA C-acetyltransferase
LTLPSSLDPRTPVVVGAATLTQRVDDPDEGVEAIELMRRVAVAAAHDSGAGGDLLASTGMVLVPKGTWTYQDPGRQVAATFGATPHTVLAEVGVLQQTMLTRAAQAIAAGRVDVALVVGGEDKHRQLRAAIAGVERPPTVEPGAPDELWRPDGDILTRVEIERDLAVPAQQYAVMEQALRHAEGRDDAAQAARLGALWARFAAVAATRPDAWDRSAPGPADIVEPGASNRMLASPYTRRLCSQWNVDQAAALVLVSAAEADRRGVPRDRWIFPWAAAESNAMIPMPARAELHRSAAMAHVGRALVDAVDGLGSLAEVDLVDLYSCFPAAVGIGARELGLDEERPLTLTGGMTFGGGPLNNYVLQALATLVQALRQQPGATGLVTAISGMMTKPGGSLWSTEPPSRPFAALDVTDAARADTVGCPLDPDATGPGRIVGATVVHDRGEPVRAVAVVDMPRGSRTVAVCAELDVARAMAAGDWGGRSVQVATAGRFVLA